MGGDVETYWVDDTWRNRMVGGHEPLPGEYRTREAASEVARVEARIRGVEHIIRRKDGTVADRRRYPRRSEELPG
ncbi:DUF2188 domain-containing protein [Nocardioides sp. YIM 152315]|uniref:DUF2188 domain-containing protein n=1 Tax=Nocardioides sp. YIM 152315 TaxID=3031760 RepID=UPI0023DBA55A|nr:DUF2188 domain-containing protein [Nocardioides sp. YIM 152315]MDF1603699.1 DUF2188 domain-containing protein [Nocardioides sp. YIM 152315]